MCNKTPLPTFNKSTTLFAKTQWIRKKQNSKDHNSREHSRNKVANPYVECALPTLRTHATPLSTRHIRGVSCSESLIIGLNFKYTTPSRDLTQLVFLSPINFSRVEKTRKRLENLELPIIKKSGKQNIPIKNSIIPTHIIRHKSLFILSYTI